VKDTIQKFKGLERQAVILAELDDVADRRELLYVGVTRARVYLAVVGTAATIAVVRRGLES
jgi:ATP-dependent exoDNAse (exonuclease V) beta subunit